MADIKQAAKWMAEGNRVRRPHQYIGHYSEFVLGKSNCILKEDGSREWFTMGDLLADDWEIAE